MIVLCDVDQVVADLHHAWLAHYNAEWNDNLTCVDLTSWDIAKFTKPECGRRIYDYLSKPDQYNDVPVISFALEGVNYLREMGHRVIFVSSSNDVSAGSKMRWLKHQGFLPGADWDFRDFIAAQDKSLVHGDVLIDDGPNNILNTRVRTPIVFSWPWNMHLANVRRAKGWAEVVRHVMDLGT